MDSAEMLKMSDVTFGMLLRSVDNPDYGKCVVTELTARGFKYSIEHFAGRYVGPARWAQRLNQHGHEHFGVDGVSRFVCYEPTPTLCTLTDKEYAALAKRITADVANAMRWTLLIADR